MPAPVACHSVASLTDANWQQAGLGMKLNVTNPLPTLRRPVGAKSPLFEQVFARIWHDCTRGLRPSPRYVGHPRRLMLAYFQESPINQNGICKLPLSVVLRQQREFADRNCARQPIF